MDTTVFKPQKINNNKFKNKNNWRSITKITFLQFMWNLSKEIIPYEYTY